MNHNLFFHFFSKFEFSCSCERSSLQWSSPMAFKNSASMTSLSSLHLSSSSTSSSPSPPHTFKNYHRSGLPPPTAPPPSMVMENPMMLSMQYNNSRVHHPHHQYHQFRNDTEKVRLFGFRRKGSQSGQPPRTRRLSGSVMSNTFIPEHHVIALPQRHSQSTQVSSSLRFIKCRWGCVIL